MSTVRAFVGLGSNLDDPEQQVTTAMAELGQMEDARRIACSSLYRTAPVGFAEQPEFVNAVVMLETMRGPRALLRQLLAIEHRHGRTRTFVNAPRTLDLDLLLYGEQSIDEAGLVVPHPRLYERAFVLAPLNEIYPEAMVPGRGRVGELLHRVGMKGVSRLEPRTAARASR